MSTLANCFLQNNYRLHITKMETLQVAQRSITKTLCSFVLFTLL